LGKIDRLRARRLTDGDGFLRQALGFIELPVVCKAPSGVQALMGAPDVAGKANQVHEGDRLPSQRHRAGVVPIGFIGGR
jgi:hypothetical protein